MPSGGPPAGAAAEGASAGTPSEAAEAAFQDPPDEPPVEDVPMSDALRAAQLDDAVLVVDGRPRYHLPDCPHLAGKDTVALPLSTARRSGFTPCAICRPDSTLLARARARRA